MLNKRVNGVLAVSRALGHSAEKAFLIGTPFTSKTMLDKDDEFLILACDGVRHLCIFQRAQAISSILIPLSARSGM